MHTNIKQSNMKTGWKLENHKKTTKDEEVLHITFKDYRGEYTVRIPTQQVRQLIEDLDKKANYHEVL